MKAEATRRPGARRTPRSRAGGKGAWETIRAGGLEILRARALAKLPWLVHGFSTRLGGTSVPERQQGKQRALNLGFTDWDTRENVLANRAKLLAALDAEDMKLATLRQFHSDVIYVLDALPEQASRGLPRDPPGGPRGDAAITRTPGLLLAVQTADCIPILLVDPERRVVAAVHAGWRGTLRRIVAKTLGRMRVAFGTEPPSVLAALGPGIGACCYEVGPEVAQAYGSQFAEARQWFEGPFERLAAGEEPNPLKWLTMAPPGHDPPAPRVQLDLVAANHWQLLDAGVKASSIISSPLCTSCRTDLLFSYRKEGSRTGRLMAVVGLRPGIE